MSKIRKVLVVQIWFPHADLPEGKVLVLQLLPERGGFWQSVTGGVEKNETYLAGALREVEEETLLPAPLAHYLGMEQEFPGQWGDAIERAFVIRYYGSQSPTPTLSEHSQYEWLEKNKAIEKVKYPFNKEAIRRAFELPPALVIDQEGKWLQAGEAITHERTQQLLNKSLRYYPANNPNKCGQFFLENQDERWEVVAQDTFLFAQAADLKKGDLRLQTGEWLSIPWENLFISKQNILYGKFNEGKYLGAEVKFSRPAYYEITKILEEAGDAYELRWQGRKFPIRQR